MQVVNVMMKKFCFVLLASSVFVMTQANAKLDVKDPLDRIVAVVNDEVITELQLNAEMKLNGRPMMASSA